MEIVNYRSKIQRIVYHKPISFVRGDVALASMKRLLMYPRSIRPLYIKWHLFEAFLADELKTTEEFHSIGELSFLSDSYDLLICGSDQIWNTSAPDSEEVFYGNWFQGKKISYAASLGQEPEKCNRDFLLQKIRNFEEVSVREQRSLFFLVKNKIIEKGYVVCDPTLLLETKDYDSIVSDEPLIKGDYVFFYTPVGLPYAYLDIASNIGHELNCKVITEKGYYPKDIKRYGNIEPYIPTGPKEFLNLIRYAKCVCGGSFHLQVLSILFSTIIRIVNDQKLNPDGLSLHVNYGEDLALCLYQYREESIQFLKTCIHE